MHDTPKNDAPSPSSDGTTSTGNEAGHVELSEQRPGEGYAREQMRNAVETALAKGPVTMILICEYEQGRVECYAVGTPVVLPAVYTAGGDALAAMMRKSIALSKAGAG